MIKFTIKGRLPGINEMTNANRTCAYKGAAQKKQAEAVVMHAAKQLGKWRAQTPVTFEYRFYEPNRRRDKDNVVGGGVKIIQDALVKGGYLPNDNWDWVEGFTPLVLLDKKNPRIEVRMWEVEE